MENINSAISSLINKYSSDTNILRKKLYQIGINTVFENDDHMNKRVILYRGIGAKRLLGVDYSLINGLIIDLNTEKILCVPQKYLQTFNKSAFYYVNTNIVNKNYNIYKLNDGTTINLYWHHVNSTWVISTTRGMDMNNTMWMGSLSYGDILDKLLLLYPKFDWDKLDKCKTYTLGFNHPNFHPFRHGCKSGRLWFIQSTHNSSFVVNRIEDIGILLQEIYEPTSLEEIITLCNKSLDVYLDDAKESTNCFGFILIDKWEQKNHHLIIKSILFQTIKNIIYSGKYNKMIVNHNYDRLSYIIIYSYLNININTNETLFLKLFPQFKCIFDQFDKKIKQITNILAMCFLAIEKDITIAKYNSNTSIHVLIRKLHTLVKDIFKKTGPPRNFPNRSVASLEIIKYIIDENLIPYYYPVFGKIVEEQLAN